MKRFIVLALISVGAFQISYAQTWESGPGKVVLNPQNAKVGIGTSRPNSKLNINAARGQDALRVQVKGHTRLYLNSNGGMTVGNYIEPPSRGLYVYGNVGIGTTKPSQKLDVNGEGRFKGLRLPSGGKLRFGMESNNSWITIQNANDAYSSSMDIKGNFYFRNTNKGGGLATAHPIGIQRDGTVTMGVWETYDNSVRDTQGHRLMVNGGILCERVKVIADVPNSDHVFEKDYDLLPLSQVKQFILENKHLPEVPSAAEFKENGYNLGEMDDLLLRKVEELTLYIIRLEEEIKDLRGEE
ncbi:MAG: hypothetical protein P8I82_06870 [Flavobacteriales bacterium]|nr:hypothetical protein [Flavobacteriales bacterium]